MLHVLKLSSLITAHAQFFTRTEIRIQLNCQLCAVDNRKTPLQDEA